MTSTLRAVFMGSPDFAVPSLRAVAATCDLRGVVSQPDRPAGRGRRLRAPPVKTVALELGVPVLQPHKVRDGTLLESLRALDPEIIVVTAYGRILPTPILTLPCFGCINVHASLLPRWRGAAPIQRSILAGDRETGVSIMQLDEGCDTGSVFVRRATPIPPLETAGELFTRLAELGGAVLEDFLRAFPDVEDPQAQDESLAVHAPKLGKSEGEIDWSRDAGDLLNHVRGMDPWPAAFTHRASGKRLKCYAAAGAETGTAEPGLVLECGESGLRVGCGAGTLVISEVQADGSRRMKAHEYAAGHAFEAEERLGRPRALDHD